MKMGLAGLVVTMLLAPIGCSETSTPGGPGAANTPNTSEGKNTTANRPAYGPAEGTFELSAPVLSTHLKQGETKTATIGVSRGKNFDEDVTLKFSDIPQGVTVEPTNPTIPHGDKDCKLTLQAASDAALGDFTIKVIGHPTKGADATTTMKLTIVEK